MSLEIGERPIIYIGEDERYRTRLIQRFNDVYSDLNLNFPEIDYDKIDQIRGMDISIITTAKTDNEAFILLKEFGMPFKKN